MHDEPRGLCAGNKIVEKCISVQAALLSCLSQLNRKSAKSRKSNESRHKTKQTKFERGADVTYFMQNHTKDRVKGAYFDSSDITLSQLDNLPQPRTIMYMHMESIRGCGIKLRKQVAKDI